MLTVACSRTGAAALTTRAGFADALSRSAARASAVGREDLVPRLGVASYSLRNFSRAQAIEMTKSLGVGYINFKAVHLAYDAPAAAGPKAGRYDPGGLDSTRPATVPLQGAADVDVGVRADVLAAGVVHVE